MPRTKDLRRRLPSQRSDLVSLCITGHIRTARQQSLVCGSRGAGVDIVPQYKIPFPSKDGWIHSPATGMCAKRSRHAIRVTALRDGIAAKSIWGKRSCHPEEVALHATTEGSRSIVAEMLRGVYPEFIEGLSMIWDSFKCLRPEAGAPSRRMLLPETWRIVKYSQALLECALQPPETA